MPADLGNICRKFCRRFILLCVKVVEFNKEKLFHRYWWFPRLDFALYTGHRVRADGI
jgi:hypothetical protein